MLAPDGTSPLEAETEVPLQEFEGTLFEAALDAEQGRAWARNSDRGIPDRWWTTQRRHLELASRLLGLAGEVNDRQQESIAAVLGVEQMLLREAHLEPGCGYRRKGAAICQVLRAIGGGFRRAVRLLFCGHLIGRWALPWWWDARRQCLERLPFPSPGIPPPT